MFETFKKDLLDLEKPKIVSSFYCDPGIESRPAAEADRKCRIIEAHDSQRELLIFLDGECERMLGDTVYTLVPGTALLIDAAEAHQGYYPADTPPGRYFWTIFRPEHMVYHLNYLTGRGAPRMLDGITNYHHYDPHWRKMLLDAWDRVKNDGPTLENLAVLSRFLQLHAARLVQVYDEALAYDGYNPDKRNRMRIERVMNYVDLQCGKDCSISRLAQVAGCSRSSFIRNFRHYAGCSVLEYVNRQRVLRYQSLLKPSYSSPQPSPLKECAKELGFSSPQAFARWRKQHMDGARGGAHRKSEDGTFEPLNP